MKLSCAVFLIALGSALAYKNYSGYQVLTTVPVPLASLTALNKMQSDPRFDFWQQPRVGRPAQVMAAPEHVIELRSILLDMGLMPSVMITDVGVTVEKERAEIAAIRKSEKKTGRAVTFDRFMEFDEIQEYLDELVAAYPDLASIEEIGQSFEGNPLRVLKISNGSGKKALFMDCVLHAREWIGPPLGLFAAQQLLENYAENKDLVDIIDWYILPVANPDGYIYSWAQDRFWRKTRKPNPGSNCVGTDPNRNFDVYWGEEGDFNPCSLTFPGSGAFSEIECDVLGNYVREKGISGELVLYMAVHSYGEYLLFPYGHTTELPPNGRELQDAGDEAAAAVRAAGGPRYTVGSAANVLYYTYGASDDYALIKGEVPYAYTWELPGGGSGGFDIPPSRIRDVVDETWPGVASLVRRAAANSV